MKFALWLTFMLFVWAPVVWFSILLFVGGLLNLDRGVSWITIGILAGPLGVFLVTCAADLVVYKLVQRR